MRTPTDNPRGSCSALETNRQQGAALIVSLILLLVMTLIGVASMRGTTLEERMAGNMRDRSIAFEAGEAGLRESESGNNSPLETLSYPIQLDRDGAAANDGLYHYNAEPLDDENDPDSINDWRSTALSLSNVHQQPGYVIEQVRATPIHPACGQLPPPRGADCAPDQMFRVIVRAWGGSESNNPRVVLESMYRPAAD